MNWGLEWLGLEPDADERAVKRAYAKRLRVTRPDEDPTGFQQLHEAYQAALAWLKFRDEFSPGAEVDKIVEAPPPPQADRIPEALSPERPPLPSPTAAATWSPEPTPDENEFARTAIRKACRTSPEEISRWLLDRPELWSVTDKARLGDALLHRLYALRAPIHEDSFDVLATFFGWNDVSSGTDAFDLEQCRARLHDLWLLRQDDVADPTVYREPLRTGPAPTEDDPGVARLRRPWNRLRALLSASLPGRAHDMGQLMARLRLKEGSRPLQPQQVAFWKALNVRYKVNGPKVQLAAFRSVLLAAGFAGLMLMLGFADGFAGGRYGYWKYSGIALGGAISILLLGSLPLPLLGFIQWQAGDEHPRPRGWIVRLLMIPVLACTALWLMWGSDVRVAGVILAWPVGVLALVRLLARGPFRMKFSPWMIGVVVVVLPWLEKIGPLLAMGEIAAIGALVLWATDAVAQVPLSNAPRRPRQSP
ncbi:hypothetical protein [Stenotrophomonas sp.]|uniref:hypothetical protein n=1 Tax=Stenotrophomonas sp. TaxID=69392 RepID=UPI002897713D|nr:hypothetical protein [Stenotrophomonas sp.]